jgi:hypothetical protein
MSLFDARLLDRSSVIAGHAELAVKRIRPTMVSNQTPFAGKLQGARASMMTKKARPFRAGTMIRIPPPAFAPVYELDTTKTQPPAWVANVRLELQTANTSPKQRVQTMFTKPQPQRAAPLSSPPGKRRNNMTKAQALQASRLQYVAVPEKRQTFAQGHAQEAGMMEQLQAYYNPDGEAHLGDESFYSDQVRFGTRLSCNTH